MIGILEWMIECLAYDLCTSNKKILKKKLLKKKSIYYNDNAETITYYNDILIVISI